MVLKETQLVITSGNATTTAFNPGAAQGILTTIPNVNYPLTTQWGGQRPAVSAGNSNMGTPIGQANNFYVMLPQPFANVVKTEIRYFFMENGISNVYSSTNAPALVSNGNNVFFIRTGYVFGNAAVGLQHKIKIPSGYYDRAALAKIILDLVNLIDPAAIADSDIEIPSQTLSNPIFNTANVGGNLVPDLNFTSCEIGPDGIFRLEALPSSPIGTDWAISFKDRAVAGIWYNLTQYLLGFQSDINSGLNVVDFEPTVFPDIIILSSPYTATIDIYNYILIQSQKLGTKVMSTSGIEAHCIVPMAGQNTQVAAATGQFSYDGGNFSLDAAYFDNPRRLDMIDIRIADSEGTLLEIGQNTITIVIRIIQQV